MGVTNQEFINRAVLNNQPGPGVLAGATRAEKLKDRKNDATCAARGSHFSP